MGLCTFMYVAVNPILMTGDWCLDYYEGQRGHIDKQGLFIDCNDAAKELDTPPNQTPSAVPSLTASIDLICIICFSIVKYFRYKRRKRDTYVLYREIVFSVIASVCVVDIIVCLVIFEK